MRMLVISHEASRSGAPILLLHFLKNYKSSRPDLKLDVILSRTGPLKIEFEKVSDRILTLNKESLHSSSPFVNFLFRVYNKGVSFIKKEPSIRNKVLGFVSQEYDVIISNTITNGAILHALKQTKGTVISYIHELENIIQACTTPDSLVEALTLTDKFIVPSQAVKQNLINGHNVPPTKIKVVNYYIPEVQNSGKFLQINIKDEISNYFLVGSVGTLEWRKGADLFLQVVKLFKLRKSVLKVKFIWVGVDKGKSSYKEIAHDIEAAGLSDDIILVEKVDNPLDFLRTMDIFLMLSREDPYPLVVLEAAMLKKPIICFDKAGGAPEFLADDNGLVVPYLDLEAVVENILRLISDKDIRLYYGERAYQSYFKKHSKEIAMKEFEKVISENTGYK